MPFTATDAKRVLNELYDDVATTLKKRGKADPEEVFEFLEARVSFAQFVLQSVEKKKKKPANKNKKHKPNEAETCSEGADEEATQA